MFEKPGGRITRDKGKRRIQGTAREPEIQSAPADSKHVPDLDPTHTTAKRSVSMVTIHWKGALYKTLGPGALCKTLGPGVPLQISWPRGALQYNLGPGESE